VARSAGATQGPADCRIHAIIAAGRDLPIDQDPKDDQRCSIS
jgi:hypothetical protein